MQKICELTGYRQIISGVNIDRKPVRNVVNRIIITLLAISILLANTSAVFAQEEMTYEEQLETCETLYEEFLEIGEENFDLRYIYSSDKKNCLVLYRSPIWVSDSSDREEILRDMILYLTGEKTSIADRERYLTESYQIPEWIKSDAKLWYEEEQTDSRFAFGIRYMINSNIILLYANENTPRQCATEQTCIQPSDYLKYSITDNAGNDLTNVELTFDKITREGIKVQSKKVAREGMNSNEFIMDVKSGTINLDKDELQDCCMINKVAYPLPLKMSQVLDEEKGIIIKNEVNTSFEHLKREAWVANNAENTYQEIIDKKTGLVLHVESNKIIGDVTALEKIDLVETNIFYKKADIQYQELKIPEWLKTTVQWWAEGVISNDEYVFALQYLINQNILKV